MRWGWAAAAAGVVVVSVVGLVFDKEPLEDRGSDSKAACQHFDNVMSDVSAGVLTDAELRRKLQEIRSSASGDARQAATDMLAAATRGDTERLVDAADAMRRACR